MSKFYFADKAEQADDLFDYAKCHLGEDRWLTHLFMIGAKRRYQIQMNTGAFCTCNSLSYHDCQGTTNCNRQDRSSTIFQKPSQTAPPMVPRVHHQRSLYADRREALETIPNSANNSTGPEHHSNNRPPLLHNGHLDHFNKPEDCKPPGWFHRRFFGPQLGTYDLLWRKAGPIQNHDVSDHVHHQPFHELDIHGIWHFHSGTEDLVCSSDQRNVLLCSSDSGLAPQLEGVILFTPEDTGESGPLLLNEGGCGTNALSRMLIQLIV